MYKVCKCGRATHRDISFVTSSAIKNVNLQKVFY